MEGEEKVETLEGKGNEKEEISEQEGVEEKEDARIELQNSMDECVGLFSAAAVALKSLFLSSFYAAS
jgi:hypothetical protein